MKIVSRFNQDELALKRLQRILAASDDDLEPADTLSGVVNQVEIFIGTLFDAITELEASSNRLMDNTRTMMLQARELQNKLAFFQQAAEYGIEYDEDLDHATIDMMEALIASGASEPTFDGELTFTENIIISKEDFKPIVRQAIESWLHLKVR